MSRRIDHHLDPATLLAFSAGTLGEALSSVASAHLEMCPHCRSELADLDLLGSLMLDGLDGAPLAKQPRLPAEIIPFGGRDARHAEAGTSVAGDAPTAFAGRIGVDLSNLPWRWIAPGIWHHRVQLSSGAEGDLRLLKISAGMRMPEHGHGGTELTLVLDGAYRDEFGCYRRGDIQDIDVEVEHRPVADPDTGCICVIASERPARYKSLFNRLLQPLTGI